MTDEQRINDYVRRLGWSLQRLEPADRAGLTGEIRSHLCDSAEGGGDALDRALAGLGAPHTLGRRFIEEYELAGAMAGSTPTRLLTALLGRSSRRAGAIGTAFAAMLLYGFALVFAVMAVAKPIMPDHVGAWRSAVGWQAGLVAVPPVAPELLGGWIVPLALALSLGCYLAGTLILRRTGGRLLGKP